MKLRYLLIGATIGVFLLLVYACVVQFLRQSLTPANTFLVNRNYSLLSSAQITTRLQNDFILPSKLKLSYQSYGVDLDLASISAKIDYPQTSSRLFPATFSRNPLEVYFPSLVQPRHHLLVVSFDRSNLDRQIASISAQLEKPYVPTEIGVTAIKGQLGAFVKKGDPGLDLDSDKLVQMIEASLQTAASQPINLPMSPNGTLPTDDQIAQTLSRANNLLGKSLVLDDGINKITLDDKTLVSWLDFGGNLKDNKIRDYAITAAASLKRDPVNAEFKVENGKVLEFRPAANGQTVESDVIVSAIRDTLASLLGTADKSLTAKITPIQIEPQIKTSDANNLGIRELLGRGTSTFHHSATIRNMNVEHGAALVNRILVAPGEEFSFLKALGDVSLATGFQMAYVIRQGKTEMDVGGGICQVSTTFFRALLNAGVKITQRQNHAYRVQYYEEDMPPGYDATVFIPSPDLRFVNDTGHFILIQSSYDGKAKSLTYELWGTSDGRQVEISNYRQWGSSPPPPERWIDDPTLPPGKVVQDEHAIPGLKTAFDWKVTRDGAVINQKTFQSVFTPWAAVYRKGI